MYMSDFHGQYQIQFSLVISNVNGQLELLKDILDLSYVELILTNCFYSKLIFRMVRFYF